MHGRGPHIPSMADPSGSPDPAAVLRFYAENGIDSVEGAAPGDLYGWTGAPALKAPAPVPAAAPPAAAAAAPPAAGRAVSAADAPMPPGEAVALAEAMAAGATDIPSLAEAINAYKGCPLHAGARQAVVFDGVPGAPVLVMGEAPGRDEDREGLPFVGRSGQLLDRMLAAIGVARAPDEGQTPACISNAIYWRPPGNRNPTKAEVAACLPFMRRFIALSAPKVLVLTGNVPTQAIWPDAKGITKTRGVWRSYEAEGRTIPTLPIFHPAFLLRQPARKAAAWRDLQAIREKLAA